jgi:hypothetical protein
MFESNLPPGCTDRDIERNAGSDTGYCCKCGQEFDLDFMSETKGGDLVCEDCETEV